MSIWPLDLKYTPESPLVIDVHGEPLTLAPLDATTLDFATGDASTSRIVGVSENANIVRFVPALGPYPLLVFPRRTLLCPANSQLKTVIDLPLFTKVGVGTAKDVREIAELKSPLTSRALYGPVDAGVLCTSIKSNVGVSVRDLRGDADSPSTLASQSSGDDPDLNVGGNKAHRLTSQDLTAYVNVTVSNQTDKPLEVAKIMIPTDLLALFDSDCVIRTGRVQMRLLSETEAELDFKGCPDTEANPIPDLHGRERVFDGRKHIFDLTYRNKTGLEYGF